MFLRKTRMTLPLSVQEYARLFNIRSRKSSLVSLFTNSLTFTLNFQFVLCLSRLGIWTNISILETDQLYQHSWDQSTIQIKEKRTSHFIQNSRHIYRGNCKQYIKLITIKQTIFKHTSQWLILNFYQSVGFRSKCPWKKDYWGGKVQTIFAQGLSLSEKLEGRDSKRFANNPEAAFEEMFMRYKTQT